VVLKSIKRREVKMGELAQLAQKVSPFLKIVDNDYVDVAYKGFRMIEDNFNPGKQKVRYLVELDGEEKYFDSGSARVMLSFDTCLEGDIVRIKKEVVNGKNKYSVVCLKVLEETEKQVKAKK
jgi:hypothetical protein